MKVNTLLEFIKTKNKRGLLFWTRLYWNHMLDAFVQDKKPQPAKLVHNPKVKTTYPEANWNKKNEFERINSTHEHLKGQLLMRRW